MRRLMRRPLLAGARTTFSGTSSKLSLDSLLGKRLRATVKELSVEMLPALKVLSESLGLLRHSPALRNWSTSDWLVGLSVLAQYKTKQRAAGLHDKKVLAKAPVVDQALLDKLLRYVRVCDAVYASSVDSFCKEAAVRLDCVLRAHPGGVVSPKCVILADHDHQELILAARGTASLLDFCTDLCLHNEPFQSGQGHRGMVHSASWLVHHLRGDLQELARKYPDYRIVVTGHSLGAAVAALTAMQLREEFPTIECYAFGTPACVTQELATGSYDFVTTVVNGYDCVPRLHQHSLMKLQEEIHRFDWRTALKEMVTETIHKQKVAVGKQQKAKLEELQVTLQTMDPLQLKQRTSKAAAKLGKAKRVASDNIKDFAHDVDTLLGDKLDAAFSVFKTDKLSLEHVSFVKKLLNHGDVKEGDSFWWKRMDESVTALERLSAAVKKPKELERVLIELRMVLERSSASSRKPSKSNDGHDGAAKAFQPQLVHSQVDSITGATASLKTRIGNQVSKVSTTVTSNVKDCVVTIKEETEALGAIVREEFDEVTTSISRNLPFAIGLHGRNTKDGQSSNQVKPSHRGEMFADADPSQWIKGESREEIEQKWKELEQDQIQWEKDNKLQHGPLFPPGRILYLNRAIPSGTSTKSTSTGSSTIIDHEASDVVEFVEVATDEFSRVVLSNRMLLDHLCTDYERVLENQAKLLKSTSDAT